MLTLPERGFCTLQPGHRRGWGSVYAALRRGHVDVPALRGLLVRQPVPEGPPVYAVDASVWPRPDAATSFERGYQYHSPRRRRAGGDPVVPGWASQGLVRLSPARDSWTAPIDVRRVRPAEKPTAVAVAHPPDLDEPAPPELPAKLAAPGNIIVAVPGAVFGLAGDVLDQLDLLRAFGGVGTPIGTPAPGMGSRDQGRS
jgi:hypothetical protein